MSVHVLVATADDVLVVDAARGSVAPAAGLDGAAPTGLAPDTLVAGRAWCCTHRRGVFKSDDGGASWAMSGLEGEKLMVLAASPARRDLVWAGVEMSAVWRSDDAGATWQRTADLEALPSSSDWAFPPRPHTHHVRWIACHPADADRLWIAVEAGALVRTMDGGRTWLDRVENGPWDSHELALHPAAPHTLRVAAGDGYFESDDGGETWRSPIDGLPVGYLRSVAVDPGDPHVVVVSAATHAHAAYVSGRSDGRVYRRTGDEPWRRSGGWPDPATTIAPLLIPGGEPGELWAADERGVHRSPDGGGRFERIAGFEPVPRHLRGLALVDAP